MFLREGVVGKRLLNCRFHKLGRHIGLRSLPGLEEVRFQLRISFWWFETFRLPIGAFNIRRKALGSAV
jgi:hypothetical protein